MVARKMSGMHEDARRAGPAADPTGRPGHHDDAVRFLSEQVEAINHGCRTVTSYRLGSRVSQECGQAERVFRCRTIRLSSAECPRTLRSVSVNTPGYPAQHALLN